ncbi:MAG: type II toxin-antitoxin system VapC family toxin [Actinobacteria bacterium]|nr:type II toxin-antitoxin system VapC family toxin [Actinomycetota bacterium]
MIVVDASVVVELIVEHGSARRLHERVLGESLIAPDFLPVEVASALRGLNLGGHLRDPALTVAADDLLRLPVDLHPSLPLVPRILALRHNLSAYDASYAALAEAFRCPLLTLDRRLADAARAHCDVEVAPA